jgi:hypothetical protein
MPRKGARNRKPESVPDPLSSLRRTPTPARLRLRLDTDSGPARKQNDTDSGPTPDRYVLGRGWPESGPDRQGAG